MTPLLWLIAGCWLDQTTVDDKLVWDDPTVLDTDPVESDLPVDDTDPTETDPDTDPDTDPLVDDTDSPIDTFIPLPTCADERWYGVAPWTSAGTTTGGDDDWTPGCAGSTAPDSVYAWRAPASGCYRFTTAGSGYDTVLALGADCETELMCSDDIGGTLQSEIHWQLDAGDDVIVAVDGYGGGGTWGPYNLNVELGELIAHDLDVGGATGRVATGNNFSDDSTLDATSCLGIDSGKDHLIRFTAAQSEYYIFDVSSPLSDITLSVFHECGGGAYECVDSAPRFANEELELALNRGETIILRIAGVYSTLLGGYDSGPWTLNISNP